MSTATATAPKSKAIQNGAKDAPESVDLLLHLYKEMLRIRRFEEAAFQQYQKGTIGGFCHLYIGQEAVASARLAASKRATKC